MRKDKILTEALKAKRLAKTSLKESLNKSLKESRKDYSEIQTLSAGEYPSDLAVEGKWTCVYTTGDDREIPFAEDTECLVSTFDSEKEVREFAKEKIKEISDVYGHNYVIICDPDCEEVATFHGGADEFDGHESLKESSSNVEALVHNIIKQFEGMNPEYFYAALMIYDVLGISNPSEALIKEVKKYLDDLDTIYDTYVRDELSILANELNSSLHSSEKHDDIVEEKLGEYRKGSKLSKNIEKEFKY